MTQPLLSVEHVKVSFTTGPGRSRDPVRAVDDVSFTLASGETLGIVGESGSGKTTLSHSLVRLTRPQEGLVRFDGHDITRLSERSLRPHRRDFQLVFQNPFGSLNPKRTIGAIVTSAIASGAERPGTDRPTVAGLLEQVGLSAGQASAYPSELSGGQCQRVAIARALAVRPRLIVLDEPVSALDVSIQAQVVNLLVQLREQLEVAYVFVAHDLSVVRHVSNRVAVMYLGKIVEIGPTDALFARPVHWYTKSLLAAVPIPVVSAVRLAERELLQGEPPSAMRGEGCVFAGRCPAATDLCRSVEPPLVAYPDGRSAACHHPRNVTEVALETATVSPDSPRSAGQALPETPWSEASAEPSDRPAASAP